MQLHNMTQGRQTAVTPFPLRVKYISHQQFTERLKWPMLHLQTNRSLMSYNVYELHYTQLLHWGDHINYRMIV